MYPDLEMARNRIAELHDMAERADLAIAIGRARRARQDRSGPAMPARLARATRRMLAPDRAGPAAGQPPARGDAPGLFRTPAGRPGQAHGKARLHAAHGTRNTRICAPASKNAKTPAPTQVGGSCAVIESSSHGGKSRPPRRRDRIFMHRQRSA